MSLRAIVWAFDQDVKNTADKFVLVSLANYATETGKAYPGVDSLNEATNLSRRTIQRTMERLCASGFITDTGKRVGATQQIKVYQLPEEAWRKPEGGQIDRLSKGGQKADKRRTEGGHCGHLRDTRARDELVTSNGTTPTPSKGVFLLDEGKDDNHGIERVIKNRMSAIYKRATTAKWSKAEETAWKQVWQPGTGPETRRMWIADFLSELEMVERYYLIARRKEDNFCRKSLLTLLRNYPGEVDRAREWCRRNPLKGARIIKRFTMDGSESSAGRGIEAEDLQSAIQFARDHHEKTGKWLFGFEKLAEEEPGA